jgi:hypothetical protein
VSRAFFNVKLSCAGLVSQGMSRLCFKMAVMFELAARSPLRPGSVLARELPGQPFAGDSRDTPNGRRHTRVRFHG